MDAIQPHRDLAYGSAARSRPLCGNDGRATDPRHGSSRCDSTGRRCLRTVRPRHGCRISADDDRARKAAQPLHSSTRGHESRPGFLRPRQLCNPKDSARHTSRLSCRILATARRGRAARQHDWIASRSTGSAIGVALHASANGRSSQTPGAVVAAADRIRNGPSRRFPTGRRGWPAGLRKGPASATGSPRERGRAAPPSAPWDGARRALRRRFPPRRA